MLCEQAPSSRMHFKGPAQSLRYSIVLELCIQCLSVQGFCSVENSVSLDVNIELTNKFQVKASQTSLVDVSLAIQ